MTIALCLNCGAKKVGAFSPCPHCNFKPETEEELTKSLLMSDRHATMEQLNGAARKIERGDELEFDERKLTALWVSKAQVDEATRRAGRNMIGCLILVVLVIATVLYLVFR